MVRILTFFMAVVLLMTGCSQDGESKVKDLEFTVVAADEIPEELARVIEEKKAQSFRLTYCSDENLYLVCGYGKQDRGGYSIQVQSLYLTENTVVLETELLGPNGDENSSADSSGSEPVIVLKTERREEPVIFR
ncbi:MAG: protease complex subunit PrcB family protein [Clostridiales bacterium]|nr:protease complex subunit PrcB family protein [Clostridiales bacterium]